MNIFDIIEKKLGDTSKNTTSDNKQQINQLSENSKQSQEKNYIEKFSDLLKAERNRFDYQRGRIKPFDNVTMKELQRLHLMAKFAKLNPNMTSQEFQQMIDDKLFVAFKNLVEEYKDGDFLEEIRDHGSIYIATKINSNRQLSKLYDAIEEIDFNKDQQVW